MLQVLLLQIFYELVAGDLAVSCSFFLNAGNIPQTVEPVYCGRDLSAFFDR